jgi:glycosidase
MEGRADPDCRRAYPVTLDGAEPEGVATRELVRALLAARRDHVALRRGSVRVVGATDRAVALLREADGRRTIVVVNAGAAPVTLELAGVSATGLRPLELPNVAAGAVLEGGAAVTLPSQSALALVDD